MKYIVRSVDGDEYGPFSREDLQNLVREERLGPGDFIRRETGKTWSPFEKIPGLGENFELTTKEPPTATLETAPTVQTAATVRTTPTRPTVGAEVVGNGKPKLESDVHSIPTDVLPTVTGDSKSEDDSKSEKVVAFEAEDRTTDDILTSAADPNTFLSLGLPITLGPEEDVHFTAAQSFIDAFRESALNAILGHRGTMVCTSRRIVVVRPSMIRASMQIAWMESTSMVGIETRRNLFRMVVGVVLLFYAAVSMLGAAMIGGAANSIGGGLGLDSFLNVAGTAGLIIASAIGLLGVLAIITASRRAMVVSSSGSEVVFGCMALGPWHLAQIDAARLSSPIASPGGDRITPPTTLGED